MKKILSFLIVIIFLSSCNNNSKQAKIELAIIGKADNSYWNEVKYGAEVAGKKLGIKINFYTPPKEDPAWQIRKLESVISDSVDGIAVASSDPKSITPLMSNIVNSDIPCIALDTDVPKGRHIYIGSSHYYTGQQSAEMIMDLLQKKSRIGIITDPSIPDFMQMVQGFKDIIQEHEEIEVSEILEKDYRFIQPEDIERMISSGSARSGLKLDGLFCVSDSFGIATAKAIEKVGKIGKIKIVSVGESTELMKAVKQNVIQVAISRHPFRLGYSSVIVLYNMIKFGIKDTMMLLPRSEMIDLGVIIVTPANINEYKQQLINLGIKVDF